jgi:hypothetical protein
MLPSSMIICALGSRDFLFLRAFLSLIYNHTIFLPINPFGLNLLRSTGHTELQSVCTCLSRRIPGKMTNLGYRTLATSHAARLI